MDLQTLTTIKDIKIERVGSWIWVSGNTYQIKDKLKEMGFFYSHNKKAWFYNGQTTKFKKYISKYKNLDEIKNTFGYAEIEV